MAQILLLPFVVSTVFFGFAFSVPALLVLCVSVHVSALVCRGTLGLTTWDKVSDWPQLWRHQLQPSHSVNTFLEPKGDILSALLHKATLLI